jgi:hypothetical protein
MDPLEIVQRAWVKRTKPRAISTDAATTTVGYSGGKDAFKPSDHRLSLKVVLGDEMAVVIVRWFGCGCDGVLRFLATSR